MRESERLDEVILLKVWSMRCNKKCMCACVLGGRMSKRMYSRFLTIPVNITKIPKNSKSTMLFQKYEDKTLEESQKFENDSLWEQYLG